MCRRWARTCGNLLGPARPGHPAHFSTAQPSTTREKTSTTRAKTPSLHVSEPHASCYFSAPTHEATCRVSVKCHCICRVLVPCDRYHLLFKKKNRGLLAQLTGPDSASACPSSNVLPRAHMGKMGTLHAGTYPDRFWAQWPNPVFPSSSSPSHLRAHTRTPTRRRTSTHARTLLSAKTRSVTQEKVPIAIPHRDPVPAPSPSLRCCLLVRMRAS